MPCAAQPRDGRRDDVDVLAAERAVFAGMRIEAGESQARPREAEIAPAGSRDDDRADLDQILGVEQRGNLRQRHVDGRRHDGESGDHSIITGRLAPP